MDNPNMLNFEETIDHDTVIEEILINRLNPGKNDCISFKLVDPAGSKFELLFTDVYYANLSLNFGVVAEETIRDVSISLDDAERQAVINKWIKHYGAITDLKCFILTTNSTNSVIKIYAMKFEIVNR